VPEPVLGPHERRPGHGKGAGASGGSGIYSGNGLAGGTGAASPPEVAGSEPARVTLVVAGPPVVAEAAIALLGLAGTAAAAARVAGWVLAVAATLALVVRPLLATMATARLDAADLRGELDAEHEDRDFRRRFERALAQTDAEPAALRTALRAVHELQPEGDIALLLAVPDEPRVGWVVRLLDGELLPARPIADTPGCTALAANTTTEIRSSTALEACAHLQDPTMEVSGTCVPLRLGDRVLGVVSVVGAPGEEIPAPTLATLEWLVDRTGVRIAEQRRMRGPSVAGREDSVTGLPGPTVLDRHLRESIRSLTPFCVALVDIDAFTELRGAHGDDEADESLRLMADTLRLTLRPDDLVCRLEGGHFGVVLSNCAGPQASAAMERVREALVLAIAGDEGPHFTFSGGIVESHRASSIEDLLEQARAAASSAHGNGGNRVAVAHD